MGFGLGAPDAFKRLRELGLSRLRVKLQDSCFLARASSSCCTSPTRASCYSRSMRSLASDNAFLRVSTSVVAPDKFMMILLLYTRTSF